MRWPRGPQSKWECSPEALLATTLSVRNTQPVQSMEMGDFQSLDQEMGYINQPTERVHQNQ